jgi:hypothetical protein|nr:MAG TPA: LysW biosynthesis protein LysW [Bacteriophage sp.]
MTENEAIEKLKNMRLYMQITDKNNDCKFTEDDYKANEMAIQALEKQIPKKPIFNHNLSDTLSIFHCECGNTIKVSHDIGIMDNNNAPNYCSKCGCRLDWSDEE